MPEKKTLERARSAKRSGKAATTQAGEFVREEMHHVRRGKHGASSRKHAVAIALSKARRSGVKVEPPARGKTSSATRKKATRDVQKGQRQGPLRKTRGKKKSGGARKRKAA
jgi:hypothetical protein